MSISCRDRKKKMARLKGGGGELLMYGENKELNFATA